jgi:hypothetical protein
MTATVFCLFASLAAAQEAPTPPGSESLDSWVGTWNATGTWMGEEATQTVTWQWVVHDWHLQGVISTVQGDQTTNSLLFLTPAGDGTLSGHWIYPFGLHFPVTGTEEGNVVTFTWTGPDGVHQLTVTRTEEGATAVHQMQGEDGTWQDVDTLTYTQAAE